MYPMALILPMAAIRRDRGILPYAIALSGVGLAISTYHVYIQLFPAESNFCEISNPCSAKWVEAFGWLTIPQMAGLSFALILVASITGVVADRRLDRGDDATTPDHESTASPRSPTR
jgi:disulfide bond formation protein DsbB